jgi:hypothetical protein
LSKASLLGVAYGHRPVRQAICTGADINTLSMTPIVFIILLATCCSNGPPYRENISLEKKSNIASSSILHALAICTRFVCIMGRSRGHKLSSKTKPVANTLLCGNISLSHLHTDYIAMQKMLLDFLASSQNLGLHCILIILSTNDFVNIEWDSVKMKTMVYILRFGILAKLGYQRINSRNICFYGCLDCRKSL